MWVGEKPGRHDLPEQTPCPIHCRSMVNLAVPIVVFGPWPPPWGGVASHILDLVSNLKRQGFSVRVLGYGDFGATQGVRKVSVTQRGWWRTRLWLSLALRPGRVLHDHSGMLPYPDDQLLPALSGIVRARRSRWVLTLHDETLIARFTLWPRGIRRTFEEYVSQPEQLICVGTRLAEFVRQRGVPAGRVTTIPPLLPLTEDASVALPDTDQRFLSAHAPTISAVGVFEANYDLLTLVRAFHTILARHPRAGLLIIDAGFTRDPGVEREVQGMLDQLPASCYRLLRCVPRDRVRALLGASTVFVRGTRLESFGLSRVEAVLGGTPVVTTSSGETRYMRLYPFGNIEKLAAEVLSVVASPPDLREAREYYERLAEQAMTKVLEVYRRVGSA